MYIRENQKSSLTVLVHPVAAVICSKQKKKKERINRDVKLKSEREKEIRNRDYIIEACIYTHIQANNAKAGYAFISSFIRGD